MSRWIPWLLAALLAAPAALAQGPAALKAMADKAYLEGDYMAALRLLDEAYTQNKDPALRANMGLVYNAMGEYGSAVEAFRAFLASDPQADKAAKAKAFIARLEPPVKLTSTPSGAQVFANGSSTALGTTPLDTRLVAGTYDLVFRLAGYADARHRLSVFPEHPAAAAVTLESEAESLTPFERARRRRAGTLSATPTAPGAGARVPSASGRRTATWGWVAVGLGVAAAGAAATTQVMGRQAADERDGATTGATWDAWDDRVSTWNLGFMASAGVAGAALTTGVVLLLLDKEAPPVQVGAGPGGVTLGGRF